MRVAQFFEQGAPAFLGKAELLRQFCELVVQPQSFFRVGRRQELGIRELLLLVELRDRPFDVVDLLAKFPFAAQGRLGCGSWSSRLPWAAFDMRVAVSRSPSSISLLTA